jgi:hypothetical protein
VEAVTERPWADEVRFLVVANFLLTAELEDACTELGFEDTVIQTVRIQFAPPARGLAFEPLVRSGGESNADYRRRLLQAVDAHLAADKVGRLPGRTSVKLLERNAAWWYLHRVKGESIHLLAEDARERGWFRGAEPDRRKDIRAAIQLVDRLLAYAAHDTRRVGWVEIRTSKGPAIATKHQMHAHLAAMLAEPEETTP